MWNENPTSMLLFSVLVLIFLRGSNVHPIAGRCICVIGLVLGLATVKPHRAKKPKHAQLGFPGMRLAELYLRMRCSTDV